MPLFDVAVMERPTKKELDEGTGQERLVFGPVAVVAQDAQSAGFTVVMENKDKIAVDAQRMQVLVRPFA